VTYKILVLDLLTKRLSPSIISGLIILNAHKSGKSGDSFITELIRKGNPDAFIKCFTEKPQALGKNCEAFMKSLQVSNLLLYPRIKKSVKDSIDSGVGMNVIENNIQMNNKMEEIHTMLIELL
jgi:DNA excision repair protein ERCC-4